MHLEVRGQLILESIPVERVSRLPGFGRAVWREDFKRRAALFFVF